VFYQPTTLLHRKIGFCVTLNCADGRVAGVELHPYRITDTGPRVLETKEEASFHRSLARISRPFKMAAGPAKAWEAWLAYYGEKGFRAEVLGILDKMSADPRKGAAMFRNRITTVQHTELWRTFLTRMMDGGKRGYSREAYRTVEEYFSKTIS